MGKIARQYKNIVKAGNRLDMEFAKNSNDLGNRLKHMGIEIPYFRPRISAP